MSGYGGQPPAWNDPNGQVPSGRAQSWNDPNGYNGPGAQPGWDTPSQPGAPSPPYGYGYGPPGVAQRSGTTPASTIAALVCTCVATALCCNVLAIPGIVTSAIALSRSQTDPRSARTLTMWSWVVLAVAVVLYIAFFALLVVLDVQSGPDYYDDGI